MTDAPSLPVRRALSWGGFVLAYVSCYFLSTALPTPVAWYFPVEHRFVMAVHPEGLAMDFYGRVLWCLVAGGGGYAAAAALARRLKPGASERSLPPLAAWCLGVVALTAGLYLYKLIGRHPTPVPFPPHYVPR
jgi:hypothetical protein